MASTISMRALPPSSPRSTVDHVALALDRDHVRRRARPSRAVSVPRPAPISTTQSPVAERAGVDDRAIGPLVDEEVLPPALLRAQPVLLEQRARVGHAHAQRQRRGGVERQVGALAARAGASSRRAAIIAALSVQRAGGGTNSSTPSSLAARPQRRAQPAVGGHAAGDLQLRRARCCSSAARVLRTQLLDHRRLKARAQIGERLPRRHAVLAHAASAPPSSGR